MSQARHQVKKRGRREEVVPKRSKKDPVIKEFDVVLVSMENELANTDLILLQHPVRGAERDPEEYIGGRIKKKHRVLELETKIPLDQSHFDQDVPERMNLKSRKLNSALVKPATNYTISFLKNDTFYIAPLKTIFQMRPDMSHLDQTISATAKNAENPSNKRITEKGTTPIQNNAYAIKKQLEDAEPWTDLRVNNINTAKARAIRNAFEASQHDSSQEDSSADDESEGT